MKESSADCEVAGPWLVPSNQADEGFQEQNQNALKGPCQEKPGLDQPKDAIEVANLPITPLHTLVAVEIMKR